MDKSNLIAEILDIEWTMFSHVQNVGGKAACQMDPNTFKIMRTSQFATWNTDILSSYLADLEAAQASGRNLMTEKYARMMRTTFPEEYLAIADALPDIAPDVQEKIDAIVAINLRWKEALSQKYTHLAERGRALRTADDRMGQASIETYMQAELQTYSPATIALYHAATLQYDKDGGNEAEDNLLNQVKQYGFASIEEAEKYFTTHK